MALRNKACATLTIALLQNIELMAQYQYFGFQPLSRLEAVVQQADEKEGNCNRSAIMFWFGADRESNGLSFWKRQARTCGPWLILVPFAGMLAAFLIYDSDLATASQDRTRRVDASWAFRRVRDDVYFDVGVLR